VPLSITPRFRRPVFVPGFLNMFLLSAIAVMPQPSLAASYDAVGDFSVTSNPNGAWSYGWKATLGMLSRSTRQKTALPTKASTPGRVLIVPLPAISTTQSLPLITQAPLSTMHLAILNLPIC
jgi:hypothetical protein